MPSNWIRNMLPGPAKPVRASQSGIRYLVLILTALAVMNPTTPAQGNELRISTLGNCRLALQDEDNQLNPLDFGHNPAYLLYDYYSDYVRFILGAEEQSGALKRPYDPYLVSNLYGGFTGIKSLSERHVVRGDFRYERFEQREMFRALGGRVQVQDDGRMMAWVVVDRDR